MTPAGASVLARSAGPVAPGCYRVLVLEATGGHRCRDFPTLREAGIYADDAATETEHGPVYSSIYDDAFRLVRRGKAYAF